MRWEKSCGAIVFKKESEIEFLIIQHREIHGNHWDFPKGHVEENETEEETAEREVFEETGIKINIIKNFREVVSYIMENNIGKDVIYFLANPLNKKIKIDPKELQDAKWLTYNEAQKILTFENAKNLLKKAKKFIEDNSISNSH